MIATDPIRSPQKILAIKDLLKRTNITHYLLFVLGLNTALRVSDLLSLKVRDVLTSTGDIKATFKIIEQKNKRHREIALNATAQKAIVDFVSRKKNLEMDTYLFTTNRSGNGPMTRQNAHIIIKKATQAVELKGNYSMHSLRKTWGFTAYNQKIRLPEISKKLGHTSPASTLRYIGVEKEQTMALERLICV